MENLPRVSFIGIVDFSQEARWIFMTESVSDLLGYEPHELVGKSSLELVHPDEFPQVRRIHFDTISQDKAAVLAYLRMKHKDPYKGYVLCAISRTVVHDVLVGSVSFFSGAKAMHNASTAQEVTVITPSASNFEFRRWGDESPMPPQPVPPSMRIHHSDDPKSRSPSPEIVPAITFEHLPNQSARTALILDRFSSRCTIIYCSNDLLLSTTHVMGRCFFDFVAKKDAENVDSWVSQVKGWGVNERGQPSDGGFGFGRFLLLPAGRDSIPRIAEPLSSRPKRGSKSRGSTRPSFSSSDASTRQRPPVPEAEATTILVDAIFSAHSDGVMVILRGA